MALPKASMANSLKSVKWKTVFSSFLVTLSSALAGAGITSCCIPGRNSSKTVHKVIFVPSTNKNRNKSSKSKRTEAEAPAVEVEITQETSPGETTVVVEQQSLEHNAGDSTSDLYEAENGDDDSNIARKRTHRTSKSSFYDTVS